MAKKAPAKIQPKAQPKKMFDDDDDAPVVTKKPTKAATNNKKNLFDSDWWNSYEFI